MSVPGARWVIVNCTGDTLTDAVSGGIATWVLGVVRAAEQHGSVVPVVTKRHPDRAAAWGASRELDYPGLAFPGSARWDRWVRRRLGLPHPWQPLWNRRVLAAIRSMAPRPCHLLFNNDPELAVCVAEALPGYVVWHLAHNTNTMHPRWGARFAERVRPLAVSDFVARWWDAHLGLPQGTTRTLHAGVDAELFAPGPKHEPPTVTYVGLLNERKGPDVLLAACEALVDVPPYSLRVVGDVHYGAHELNAFSRRLHEAADRLRQRGVDVTFTGFVPRTEVARLLASSSIHVVPSRWEEPFSLAALEGMASGAATIVTNRGGLPEAAGGAGLVVPADDPLALADALRRLLTDADDRHRLAERGRNHALEMAWSRTWHGLSGLEPSLHGS